MMAIATGNVARSMYTLYKEMIDDLFGDDGCDMTLSENHGYPVQAHHCISCSVMAKTAGGKLATLAKKSGYDINGRIEIAVAGFGKKVGAAHGQLHGTGELIFRRPLMTVFEGNARVDRLAVQMVKQFQPFYDAILQGFGQGDIMRRKN